MSKIYYIQKNSFEPPNFTLLSVIKLFKFSRDLPPINILVNNFRIAGSAP